MWEQILFKDSRFPVIARDGTRAFDKNYVGMTFDFHFHRELEFLCVKSGRMKIVTNTDEYNATKGEVVFINSRVPHETYFCEPGTDNILVQFASPDTCNTPIRYLEEFTDKLNTECFVFDKSSPYAPMLEKCMKDMSREYSDREKGYRQFIEAIKNTMMGILYRAEVLSEKNSVLNEKSMQKILPVINYVDENCKNEISLDTVCNAFHFNSSYFSRMFRRTTGKTFTEYLNFVRISKAKAMLEEDYTVSETAYSVGFASLSYFDRVFKKYVRCSPNDYKKSNKTHFR